MYKHIRQEEGGIKMGNKYGLKVLVISTALVILASSMAMYSLEKEGSGLSEGGEKGVIPLMPPPFTGIADASSTGSIISQANTSFLEEEAGVCAYTKLTPPVNLITAKTAFKAIEYECEDYIIGSVAVSDDESDDVHVYVSKDGWLVAYYLKEEPFPKILKTMMNFDDNKLKDALKKVCDALWVSLPTLNYYDFRYPNANKVMIIADNASGGYTYGSYSDSFRFMIPKEVAINVSKMYWVIFLVKGDNAYLYLDGTELTHLTHGEEYGELTFAQPGVPGNIIPGDYYTVEVKVVDAGYPEVNGGILLIYRE